jgi:hypothetical protein
MVLRLGSATASYDYFAALVAMRGPGDASQGTTISRRLEMFITGRNIEGLSPMLNNGRMDDHRGPSEINSGVHAACMNMPEVGIDRHPTSSATKTPTKHFLLFFTFSFLVHFGSHSLSSQFYRRSRSLLSAGMDGLVFLLHFSVGVGWFCVDFAFAFIFSVREGLHMGIERCSVV